MTPDTSPGRLPPWLPEDTRAYLAHTEMGLSLRALARQSGLHASTVMRRVRRVEALRDDPLIDQALRRFGAGLSGIGEERRIRRTETEMTAIADAEPRAESRDAITPDPTEREMLRILQRLGEAGTCLAVAPGMEKAVVVRETADGQTLRVATTPREVAEAMALRDWIAGNAAGRILRYRLTQAGRGALRRMQHPAAGDQRFAAQHRDIRIDSVGGREIRSNAAESPLTGLARRKDRDGRPFLDPEMVRAGERLREDFELAQMGPRVAQNWDRLLTAGTDRGRAAGATGLEGGSEAARARLNAALEDLGPGLADVVLRTCCFLEGMEAVERRMGWAARSGKIVLRIALQRLKRHYDEVHGGRSPLIG